MATGFITGEAFNGIAFDKLHRITVDEYERLAESGVLDDPHVELINGLLVKKMTKQPRHVSACELVAGALEASLPEGWYIREQNPLRIPDYDEPEPDVVIARGLLGCLSLPD
jgi:Uma2 family endonuclease